MEKNHGLIGSGVRADEGHSDQQRQNIERLAILEGKLKNDTLTDPLEQSELIELRKRIGTKENI